MNRVYTFKCIDCSHVFEYMQKFEDDPPACTQCGEKTERIITTTKLKFNEPHLNAKQRLIY